MLVGSVYIYSLISDVSRHMTVYYIYMYIGVAIVNLIVTTGQVQYS